MIAALVTALAMAGPAACDPAKDTAPVEAGGYCLDEAGYLELGELWKKVKALETTSAAKDEEIESFDAWKERKDAILTYTVEAMNDAHVRGIDLVVTTCQGDLEACRQRARRTPLERHGFAIGIATGTAAAIGLMAVVLKTDAAAR